MSINLLYMNQGGGGNWGVIPYLDSDVLCLAESRDVKKGFIENYNSKTQPPMSVQTNNGNDALRIISAPVDLDTSIQEVRPMLTFQLTGTPVRVVFFHLKSASDVFASKALDNAISSYVSKNYNPALPVLWIGDFNRAEDSILSDKRLPTPSLLLKGGGVAKWDLDRAYCTGDWSKTPVAAKTVSISGDNQHIGIRVAIN